MIEGAMLTVWAFPAMRGGVCQRSLWRLVDEESGEVWHVVVSSIPYLGSDPAETLIFPATGRGEITSHGHLVGSYRGGTDHALAMAHHLSALREAAAVTCPDYPPTL